jgi:hypothetical protein
VWRQRDIQQRAVYVEKELRPYVRQ